MKIAITGGSGLLGASFLMSQRSEFEFFQLTRELITPNEKLDQLGQWLNHHQINCIIHCAANTNVEDCEGKSEETYISNTLITEQLAEITYRLKIKCVFISSTGCYGVQKQEPYIEYDKVVPTTVHHRSKFLAEEALSKINPNHLIIRTGWVFGGPLDSPKNFVVKRIEEARTSEDVMQSDESQWGNPTYVGDLVNQILLLIQKEHLGVFNCVGQGRTNRFGYVSEIVKISGVSKKVEPVGASHFNRKAKVSFNESAINFKLESLGINIMRPWEESLRDYIRDVCLKS